jgi:crotonobetainyl-CoA:carnitine CoA-transferase CaiB-like acyl-CoA transferase
MYFDDDKDQLWPILDEVFAQKPTAEWCRLLGEAGLRFAPVRNHAEVAADPGVRANGYITSIAASEQEVVRPPVRFGGQEAVALVEIPELGQHTEEVLLENGFSWDEIGSLAAEGAI